MLKNRQESRWKKIIPQFGKCSRMRSFTILFSLYSKLLERKTKLNISKNANFNNFSGRDDPSINESSFRRYFSHRRHDVLRQHSLDPFTPLSESLHGGSLRYSSSRTAQPRLRSFYSIRTRDHYFGGHGLRDT
jgi:hypothetical protein